MKTIVDPSQDGVSHINIYSQGKTSLGRMLSNFYRFNIDTKDGEFSSVEGYWYWLSIKECEEKEALRELSGYSAKKIGSSLKKDHGERIDEDFEDKIIRAIWDKVKHSEVFFYTPLAKLPFEHYYNFGGKVVDVKDKYIWMIDAIDRMRNYIINQIS